MEYQAYVARVAAVIVAAKYRYGEDYNAISNVTLTIVNAFPATYHFDIEEIWNALELARTLRELE